MEVPRRDAAAGEWRAPSTAGNRKKIARRPGNRKGPAERPGEERGKAAKAAGKQRKAAAAGAKPGYGEQPGEARKRVREPRKSRKATPVCRMFHDITLSHEMKILITGAAGFIGYHLCRRLLDEGHQITGIDSLNDYYDVRLKLARLAELGIDAPTDDTPQLRSSRTAPMRFAQMHIEDVAVLEGLFAAERFDRVIHLAAQAGVRYSLENPIAYASSNVLGFVNLLECCRKQGVGHVLYASSSSVYGGNTKVPFAENDPVNHPVSLYAATKRSDELIAEVYARLYALPLTGLRFFTVYGPWGRPDMAPMLFTRSILAGKPIRVFNHGDMRRDFTYIDDIVEGVVRLLDQVPSGAIPTELFNIGHGSPMELMEFIHTLERALSRTAQLDLQPMQPGDVPCTWADTTHLQERIHFQPRVTLAEGIGRFAAWYLSDKNPLKN